MNQLGKRLGDIEVELTEINKVLRAWTVDKPEEDYVQIKENLVEFLGYAHGHREDIPKFCKYMQQVMEKEVAELVAFCEEDLDRDF